MTWATKIWQACDGLIGRDVPPPWGNPFPWRSMTSYALADTLPPLLVAFAVYGVLSCLGRKSRPDSETRCRKCGYILRGISEPRCSECGERI